jgi:hypothetical protein
LEFLKHPASASQQLRKQHQPAKPINQVRCSGNKYDNHSKADRKLERLRFWHKNTLAEFRSRFIHKTSDIIHKVEAFLLVPPWNNVQFQPKKHIKTAKKGL